MLFYTQHITPRVTYMVAYLNEKIGLELSVTDNRESYLTSQHKKVNYSGVRICKEEFFIRSGGLLHQKGIESQTLTLFQTDQGWPAFFRTDDSDLSFDLLAAAFFLLSRYEEYGDYETDEYGRYAHWNALAWKHGFLDDPLVDRWILYFRNQLQLRFPDLQFQTTAFSFRVASFLPTYDIDIAWSVKHKGWIRICGSLVKHPFSLVATLKILLGLQQDPFDVYEWLAQLHREHRLPAVYFFLVAQKKSSLDKNIAPRKKAFQQLIRFVASHSVAGLHPSVFSNTSSSALIEEKTFLQKVLRHGITQSRQHYLRFHLPQTYRILLEAGITDDYSMGYGTVNGFRASTSHSFLWYDLGLEQSTSLRIHPVACMDANYLYELKQNPEGAFASMKQLYERVHQVHGQFITIFHNSILGLDKPDRGWAAIYSQFLEWQRVYAASDFIL